MLLTTLSFVALSVGVGVGVRVLSGETGA